MVTTVVIAIVATSVAIVTTSVTIVAASIAIVVTVVSAVVSVVVVTITIIIVVVIAVVITVASVLGSIALINQVHIAEIPVVVLATIAVFSIGRVACSGSTGLLVAVSIGAVHEGFLVAIVETVIAAFTRVFTVIGVSSLSGIVFVVLVVVLGVVAIRGHSQSHECGESDQKLHGDVIVVRASLRLYIGHATCFCSIPSWSRVLH